MTLSVENPRIEYFATTLWKYRWIWLAPAVAGFVLAVIYVLLLRSESWTARQSFIVRDDLTGQAYKPGRFDSLDSMKSAQETILEISRRPQVIRNALEKLGPGPNDSAGPNWIDDELIEEFQGNISFSAPNGAEFGKTEVIVLTTQAATRERSREFIQLLSQEIVSKVNQVRTIRLQGMEAELLQTRDGAVRQQRDAEKALQELDKLLGPDVGVMNALNDTQGADTPIKREIQEIKSIKRGLVAEQETAETIRKALFRIYDNPEQISYLSSSVLREQSALESLQKELVQLRATMATALASNQETHPVVRNARMAVEAMENQLFLQVKGEIEGLQVSMDSRQRKIDKLDADIKQLEDRLVTLSQNRAKHLRLTTELRQLTESANRAQTQLQEIQSLAHAARSVGLLTPVDEPQVATRPDGISKKVVCAAGGFAGLMFGFGLVMIVAPPMVDPNQPALGASIEEPAVEVAAAAKPSDERSSDTGQSEIKQSATAIQDAASAMRQAAEAMQSAATIERSGDFREALEQAALPQSNRSLGADVTDAPTHRKPSTTASAISAIETAYQQAGDPGSWAFTASQGGNASQPSAATQEQLAAQPDLPNTPAEGPAMEPVGMPGTRKQPSPRPVDLLKSAADQREFSPVESRSSAAGATAGSAPGQATLRESASTMPIERSESQGTHSSAKHASMPAQENPFLRDTKQSAPGTRTSNTATGSASGASGSGKLVEKPLDLSSLRDIAQTIDLSNKPQANPSRSAAPTVANDQSNDGIDDQIRQLSDSIAQFVRHKENPHE